MRRRSPIANVTGTSLLSRTARSEESGTSPERVVTAETPWISGIRPDPVGAVPDAVVQNLRRLLAQILANDFRARQAS
jgi:hypothetical protein